MSAKRVINKTVIHQPKDTTTHREQRSLTSPATINTTDETIDMMKVDRIRRALIDGEIKVNSERLAQKMLDIENALFTDDSKQG